MAKLFKKTTLVKSMPHISQTEIDSRIEIISKWRDAYKNLSLQKKTESQCEQSFNQDFFIKILGYTPLPAEEYNIEPKARTVDSSQKPDAVLGFFKKDEDIKKVTAVCEIKDANTALDKNQKRKGNDTPIQQGFKYKTKYLSCDFVIVTNFYEIRLLQDNELDYEQWTLDSLVDPTDNYYQLRKLCFLLSPANFLSNGNDSLTKKLLSEIRVEEEKITAQFYSKYQNLRLNLINEINKQKTEYDIKFSIEKAQKIIDRIIFAAFCEDLDLLPQDTLAKVINYHGQSYASVWDTLKGFFNAIDNGSEKLGIQDGYNGELFKTDNELDQLQISDDLCSKFMEFGNYNFREDFSVNILGRIFEQSINDIEQLKRDNGKDVKQSRKKIEGIYYTPTHIVDYIVRNSVGRWLKTKEEFLLKKNRVKEGILDVNYDKRLKTTYLEYQKILQEIKILDPACGSGAFLVGAFNFLLNENKRVGKILGNIFGNDIYYRAILEQNLFGVDLNSESVEITKLSLWLKTAQKGKKLTNLKNNIFNGNSLISDSSYDNSFSWETTFAEILDSGGFDIVIGNPPYVDSESMVKNQPEERKHIGDKYLTANGNWDLFIPFVEQGMEVLKKDGYLSFIVPNKIIGAQYAKSLREWLSSKYDLKEIVDLSSERIFKGVGVYPVIFVTQKSKPSNKLLISSTTTKSDQKSVDAQSKSANWAQYFAGDSTMKYDKLPVLKSVSNLYSAASVAEAYELKEQIIDDRSASGWKVINTGTIDPYICLWGIKRMQYIKGHYDFPKVAKEKPKHKSWQDSPKIIVAGMSKKIEAFLDINSEYIPAKSTAVITTDNDNKDYLYYLYALLNSSICSEIFTDQNNSQKMAGGFLNINKNNLENLPIPQTQQDTIDFIISETKILSKQWYEVYKISYKFNELVIANFDVSIKDWLSSDWTKFVRIIRKLGATLEGQREQEWNERFTDHQQKRLNLMDSIFKAQETLNNIITKLYSSSL